jgi:hypothetical protein
MRQGKEGCCCTSGNNVAQASSPATNQASFDRNAGEDACATRKGD